jgi:dienelactone hydrolase
LLASVDAYAGAEVPRAPRRKHKVAGSRRVAALRSNVRCIDLPLEGHAVASDDVEAVDRAKACAAGLLAGVALLGAGCGSDRAEPRTAAPTVTRTPQPPPHGITLRFRAIDGKKLRGTLIPGPAAESPAVVLVHQVDGGPEQWDDLIPYLHEAGYATFAYGSRGHGLLDEALLARDVAGAVRALRRQPAVDPDRLAVIGASIGATAASWFAGTPAARGVRAVVALSPPPFRAPPRRYRPRELLLLADEAEVAQARAIADAAVTGVTVETTAEYGHGITLIAHAAVRAAVLRWLGDRMK